MKNTLFWIGIIGTVAVILGAFGAHGLKPHLSPDELNRWEKAVHYQFYHLPALYLASRLSDASGRKWSSLFFVLGILFFSGSLYLLACMRFVPIPVSIIGPITPIGGLLFIAGWVTLAWYGSKEANT